MQRKCRYFKEVSAKFSLEKLLNCQKKLGIFEVKATLKVFLLFWVFRRRQCYILYLMFVEILYCKHAAGNCFSIVHWKRSSHQRCSIKKGVFRNFTKLTEKHLYQSLFFNKGLRPATLLKKRLWCRCFPVNFAKFLRNPFYKEHLWWLLLTET